MKIIILIKDQYQFIESFRRALSIEPIFVFDRCQPTNVPLFKHNTEGEGFLAGRMRDLGAEGIDDDILFLDGDKVPKGDIIADIENLKSKYDAICYGIDKEFETSALRSPFLTEDSDGIMPCQENKSPIAMGCYTCGMWVSKEAIRKIREINGGRIFHPALDGNWGDEDNFLADELNYSGFKIGYSTHVRLSGKFSDYTKREDQWLTNFIKRIDLRKSLFNAEA